MNTQNLKAGEPLEVIPHIAKLIEANGRAIDNWFAEQYKNTDPFFYCSVDLRHSGWKIAPVDTNLFPAGFNLLTELQKEHAATMAKAHLSRYHPDTHNILIIPENHTRNLYYLDNVVALKSILEKAGKNVAIGGLEVKGEPLTLESASGATLSIEPLDIKNGQLIATASNFVPDVILVNNDMVTGAPYILRNLEQPVIPPVGMGWYQRSKTRHFDTYMDVVRAFAARFGIDEWLISTIFHKCGTVNFKESQGLECVSLGVERVLQRIRKHYDTYGITETPYVFIKADSGTYGMGIMTVRSPEEILELNKKSRNKMNIIKEGVVNTEVIIQEGVPTIDTINDKPAEPLMYLIGGESIGCTYRVNESRDAYSNLNASGMTFNHACENDKELGEGSKRTCPVLSLIAKLAALAATRECYDRYWNI